MGRLERVTQLLKDEISQIIQQDLKDDRLGFITITGVKLTPDLHQAWVYFSVLGEAANKQKVKDGLESASGYIKKLIGQRVKMRYTPDLNFELDDTYEKINHIESILNKIKKEEK